MPNTRITAIVDRLESCDPAVLERDEAGAGIRDLHHLKSWADAQLIRYKRRLDELHAAGRSESAGVALTDEGSRSGKDAKAIEDREAVCADHPPLEDALAAGETSTAHLDVLARLTRPLSDVERADLELEMSRVMEWARHDYVSEFERKVKQVIATIREAHAPGSDAAELDRQRDAANMKRWTDRTTGMKLTLLSMDPLRDAEFHAMVQSQLARLRQRDGARELPYGSLQIDAVIAATASSDEPISPRLPGLVIHVDDRTVVEGRHDHTICETVDGAPVPVSTAVRLGCDAILTAAVVDADGVTRRLSTTQRTANDEQRTALAAMYSTCAHPHCQVSFSNCRIHHVIWWSKGGTTAIENLLPLCERHHHLVHEGGWSLRLDPDSRRATWIRPGGEVWCEAAPTNRRPERCERPALAAPPPAWRQPSLC